MCPPGTYQPGGMVSCQACPNATFYAPVDGSGETWTSSGTTTFPGATGTESCVPKESQLSPEAGQAYFSSAAAVQTLLTSSSRATLALCLASCPSDACCIAQYDAASKVCKTATLAPVGADSPGYKLMYKLPPSTIGSASSLKPAEVKAKMMSSGIYARAAIPDNLRATWLLVGTNLGRDARTFSSAQQATLWQAGTESSCKAACDNSNVCWGFIFDGSQCLFRGGEDALNTRAFFVLPRAIELSPYNWQGATPLELAIGQALSLAAVQGVSVSRAQVVAALTEVFTQTGVYNSAAALQRIAQEQQQQQVAALSEAVARLLALAAEQGIATTQEEATEVLTAQGSTFDVEAALQIIIARRQGALGSAVAKVQDAAPGRGFAVPTWSQAVAALMAVSPEPGKLNIDGAIDLCDEANRAAANVLTLADNAGFVGLTSIRAVDALLSLYLRKKELSYEAAFKLLSEQRSVAASTLVAALDRAIIVSQQQALDAANLTLAKAQKYSADAALEWLVTLNEVAAGVVSAVRDKEKETGVTNAHVMSVTTSVFADTGDFNPDIAIERALQLSRAADDLWAKAQDLGLQLAKAQAPDMLLSTFAYTRTLSVDATWQRAQLLADRARKLQEWAKDAHPNLTPEQVVGALLAVYDQVGSFDVDAARKQAALLGSLSEKVLAEAEKQQLSVSEADAVAAIAALYSRVGYDAADVSVCTAYLRLVVKQR